MITELKEKLEVLEEEIRTQKGKTNSEENLKVHLTTWVLGKLGYDTDTFDYEHALCRRGKDNRHADIYIPIDRNRAMFVETKKYSQDLKMEDLLQLADYMNLHNQIAWGILTNGRQYYLLNNSINIYGDVSTDKDYLSKVVLVIE